MKKLLALAGLALASTGSVLAQNVNVLVAGWDFEFTQANYQFNAGTADDGILAANYADSYIGANGTNNPVADGASAASRGTLYLNGTNGSGSGWTFASPSNNVTKSTSIVDVPAQVLTRAPGTTKLGEFGGLVDASMGLKSTPTSGAGRAISFVINTTDLLSLSSVTYRSRVQTAGYAPTIDWSVVVGGNTFALGGPVAVDSGTVFDGDTIDLSSVVLGGATSVQIIGLVNATNTSNNLFLDNLAVYGVIPEPSTYAAILGLLTVGFAAVRRRFARAA